MAASEVIRLHNEERSGKDDRGVVTATVVYLVTNSTFLQAPSYITAIGQPHPELGTAYRSYSVGQEGANARVTLTFSSSNGPGPDDLDEGFGSSTITSQETSSTYPEMVRVDAEYQVAGDPPTVETQWWWKYAEDSPQTITAPSSIHTYRTAFKFQFDTVTSGSQALRAVMSQAGDLHDIGGDIFMFKPRIIDQETPDTWRVEYSWVQDRGIPLAGDYSDTMGHRGWLELVEYGAAPNIDPAAWAKVHPFIYDGAGYWGPAGVAYIRLPYHNVRVVPFRGDPAAPGESRLPTCVQWLARNTTNLDAWQNLPGISV